MILPRHTHALALVALALAIAPGCALTSKSTPAPIHYYTPEPIDAPRVTAAAPAPSGQGHALRLGRVVGAGHLRTKIVVRSGPNELATYDDDRWTESPEVYLRRSLERALFQEGRLARGYTAAAPVLEVELVSFEEVRRGASVSGRVEVAFLLRDEQRVLAEGRFATEQTSPSPAMRDVAAAIGAALEASTRKISGIVEARVASSGTPAP